MTASDLIDLRERLSWSQAEVARNLEVSRSTVVRWEKGRRPIPKMASLALTWLLVNMEMVLEEKGPPSPCQ